jgi:hypothetical protein
MSARRAPLIAWSLSALALALIACAVGFGTLSADVESISFPLATTASAVVGGLVASRRPVNPVGWLFLASATCNALQSATFAYATYGLITSPGALPFAGAMAWVSEWTEPWGSALLLVVLPFFFPNGRLVSPGWRPVARLVFLASVVGIVLRALMPGVVVFGASRVANPMGVEALRPFLEAIGPGMWYGSILVAVASLMVRFGRSRGEERQQIKWLAWAALAIPVWFLTNAPIEAAVPNLFLVVDAVIVFALIPIAAGVAILRYRLYDIDLLINRTLVYGALTASLALVYFGGVTASQAIFRSFSGQQQQPQLALVVSTLVIAALFAPLRRRIQSFIDRRFYRRKYDAAKTLEAFGSRLRDQTNLDALSNDVVRVAETTVQPAYVSLWLRPDPEPEARSAALRQFGRDE